MTRRRDRGADAVARLDRVRVVLDELVAIQLDQGATTFVPGFRIARGRAAGTGDAAAVLAAVWEAYAPFTRGGTGSPNDLVFWPDDHAERVAVNERWQALRAELLTLLAPADG